VLTLIDFEYGGWNPAAFDIATYFNEMALDNSASTKSGTKLYLNNFPTEQQRSYVIMLYMYE
jgi:thiamine kinase-like enzyme